MRVSYLIAAGIALAAGAWVYSGQFLRGGAADDAGMPASIPVSAPAEEPAEGDGLFKVRVNTLKAEERVNQLVVLGRTEESRRATLSAETGGRIAAVIAKEGDRVDENDVVARIAMNDRQAWLEMAESRVEQREMEYQAARELSERNFRSKTGLAQTAAELAAARAEVEARRLDIARTDIRAPFAGILETREVEVGDVVKVETPVATLVDLSPILIVGHVTETDVSGLRVGDPASARLVTGREVAGTIRYVASVADPATRTFRVEIEAPNTGLETVAGMTAELRLPQQRVMAHRVSPAVLTLDPEGRIGVKAVDNDQRVTFHPVKLVADGPDGMWLGGLPDVVTVVTVGQEFVNVGQKVHAVQEKAITAQRDPETLR